MKQNSEIPDQEKGGSDKPDNLSKLKELRKVVNKEFTDSLKALENSIDILRVIVKYLQFDVEATRRENEALRVLLRQYEEGG